MLHGTIAKIILKCHKRRLDSGAYFPVVILAEFFERFRSGIVGQDHDFELDLRNDYDVEKISK